MTARATRSIAEAVFCTDAGPPPDDRLSWVETELEDFLHRCGGRSRLVYAAAVFAVLWLAPLLILRLPPLGRLPLSSRVLALTRMEDLVGGPLLLVKAILCILYYEHPDAQREVGFDARCREESAGAGAA